MRWKSERRRTPALGREPMSILQRFGFHTPAVEHAQILAALEEALARLEPRRAEWVAIVAALLVRVAYVDDEISEAELEAVRRAIVEEGSLSEEEARAVAAIARDKTILLRGGENHLLTRRANEIATTDERRRLVRCLYAVAAADDLVSHAEDGEVRSIADALLVPRSEIFEARSAHRDALEELRLLRHVRAGRRST